LNVKLAKDQTYIIKMMEKLNWREKQ